ncbi:hypothetical protein K402DRAFT_400140 [Aulographum hederae CBS 113979]|uniref:Uncharacterized protein n=1 Tax=Aulographum hederae CBS 113979 TaxID=1176131 RepID=A0A6G1HE96_9PEZI|nr:hypothetical protein K402DRAFT_400140 [Aulographum hederae CBS 113979]
MTQTPRPDPPESPTLRGRLPQTVLPVLAEWQNDFDPRELSRVSMYSMPGAGDMSECSVRDPSMATSYSYTSYSTASSSYATMSNAEQYQSPPSLTDTQTMTDSTSSHPPVTLRNFMPVPETDENGDLAFDPSILPYLQQSALSSASAAHLECPFRFLLCPFRFPFTNGLAWREHAKTHFRTHTLPRTSHCPFCPTSSTSFSSWDARMDHVEWHHHNGQTLEHGNADNHLFQYLWSKRIIRDHELKDLKENGVLTRPMQEARPVAYTMGEREERRERRLNGQRRR